MNLIKSGSSAIHKDLDPGKTVQRINGMLSRMGFSFSGEISFSNSLSGSWSCHLKDYHYPLIFSNGKGINKEFALASAYAEFIERLQCYFHERVGMSKNVFSKKNLHPDASWIDKEELFPKIAMFTNNVDLEKIPVDALFCLPFVIPFQKKIELLPYHLLLSGTRSTGMCAGNSPEEAISQGICEIMERYAFRSLASGRVDYFPDIQTDSLPLTDPISLKIFSELKKKGLDVIVKDCTMGGKIPVIAVIVIDRRNDSFGVAFGSDAVFDIAFQRCVTELYQNSDSLRYSFSKCLSGEKYGHDLFNNPQRLLRRLMNDAAGSDFKYMDAFAHQGGSNRFYLRFLLNILRKNNNSICIRDFSFLSFPSYYIVISGMSLFPPVESIMELDLRDIDSILAILCGLNDQTSKEEIRKLADIFLRHYKNDSHYSVNILVRMENLFYRIPVFAWMNPCLFMAFVFIEIEEYEAAIDVLYRSESIMFSFSEENQMVAEYCRYKIIRQDDKIILAKLKDLFPHSSSASSLEHLVNRKYSSFYNKDAKESLTRKFDGLPLPRCLDSVSCALCLCQPYCYIEKVSGLYNNIQSEYVECDQTKLLMFFDEVLN